MNNTAKDPARLKVLIAVDIQNCFIHGGSLAAPLKDAPGDTTEYKSAAEYIGGEDSIKQAKEVFGLMKAADIVVITRDSHPDDHKSFSVNGGIFNDHCRKSKAKSGKSIKPSFQNINKTGGASYKGNLIVGTDPAVAFDMAAEGNNDYAALLARIKKCDMNIGITDEKSNLSDPTKARYECIGRPSSTQIFIDVRKGEFPTMDAYSAFMYHVTYPANGTISNDGPVDPLLSTRLLETLFSKEVNPNAKPMDIEVCGLVGNICVMYTVSYGNAYYQLVTKDSSTFKDNITQLGLTPPDRIPAIKFKFLGRNGTRWLRTLDGQTPFFGYSPTTWQTNDVAKDTEIAMIQKEVSRIGSLENVTIDFNPESVSRKTPARPAWRGGRRHITRRKRKNRRGTTRKH
jgi:nicotinamidase-related amidase